jgi:hypothetical protein
VLATPVIGLGRREDHGLWREALALAGAESFDTAMIVMRHPEMTILATILSH